MFPFRLARLLWIAALLSACSRVPDYREPAESTPVGVTVFAGGIELLAEWPESGEGEWLLHLTRVRDSKRVSGAVCAVAGVRGEARVAGIVKIESASANSSQVSYTVDGKAIVFEVGTHPDDRFDDRAGHGSDCPQSRPSRGGEIQAPMAMVILFGLLSSTLLNMFVVPALYYRTHRRAERTKPGPAIGVDQNASFSAN